VPIAALLVAFIATTASAATGAAGSISRTGTAKRYTLTIQNTGTTAIFCMRFTAAEGVTVTSASGPGATAPTGTTGFAAQDFAIPPGGSADWTFETEAEYPTDAGGSLQVSASCTPGSDVEAAVAGPPAADANRPCRCQSFFVRGSHVRTPLVNDKIDLDVNLAWTLICTRGRGGCRGTIDIDPPPGFTNRLPRRIPVTCEGRCKKTTEGNFRLSMRTLFKNFTPKKRANRTYTIKLRRTCQGRPIPGALRLQVAFNGNGVWDRKKSDLS
jgi:hypothetical protein